MYKGFKRFAAIAIAVVLGLGPVNGYGVSNTLGFMGNEPVVCYAATKKIQLSETTISMREGDQFPVKLLNATGKVAWKVGNTAVAKVASTGMITAVGTGKTVLQATNAGKNYKTTITVKSATFQVSATQMYINYKSWFYIATQNKSEADSLILNYDSSALDVELRETGDTGVYCSVTPIKTGDFNVKVIHKSTKETKNVLIHSVKTSLDEVGALTAKKIYSMANPSTVQVNTDIGLGSGFSIEKGVIITNYHVIEGASKVEVELKSGVKIPVTKVIGYDSYLDIALLEINQSIPILEVNTHGVSIGDTVYTLGSPLGLTDTFTNGIVTNNNRIMDNNNYIQTNAAISPGNSGGPLLNAYGQVMGINTMSSSYGQNINLAIDINEVYGVERTRPISVADLYAQYQKTHMDEDETKTVSQETAQKIQPDTFISGYMDGIYNITDYYKIDIAQSGTYEFYLSPEYYYDDMILFIFEKDIKDAIDYKIEVLSSSVTKMTVELSAGSYYLGVYRNPLLTYFTPQSYQLYYTKGE